METDNANVEVNVNVVVVVVVVVVATNDDQDNSRGKDMSFVQCDPFIWSLVFDKKNSDVFQEFDFKIWFINRLKHCCCNNEARKSGS